MIPPFDILEFQKKCQGGRGRESSTPKGVTITGHIHLRLARPMKHPCFTAKICLTVPATSLTTYLSFLRHHQSIAMLWLPHPFTSLLFSPRQVQRARLLRRAITSNSCAASFSPHIRLLSDLHFSSHLRAKLPLNHPPFLAF